jgi:hypothetical protein
VPLVSFRLVKVDACANPVNNLLGAIKDRRHARTKPAINTVEAPEAELALDTSPGPNRIIPDPRNITANFVWIVCALQETKRDF